MIADENEIRNMSNIVFSNNMDKHGFSFSPEGLYRAALDKDGNPYKNWKLKMQMHQPEPAEHPKLYEPPRYITARYFEHSKRKAAQ
jgi:hypothetical protein